MHTDTSPRAALRTRRSFVQRAGLGGLALAVADSLLPLGRLLPASAQTDSEELTGEEVLDFLYALERSLVEFYRQAEADGLVVSPEGVQAITTFRAHHEAHAEALRQAGASAGRNEFLERAILDRLAGQGDEETVLALAYELEQGAAATHLFASGLVEDERALERIASILPVEAAHAAVLGDALARPSDAFLPTFQTEQGRAEPSIFAEQPAETETETETEE